MKKFQFFIIIEEIILKRLILVDCCFPQAGRGFFNPCLLSAKALTTGQR
jgi:hypothetical protein